MAVKYETLLKEDLDLGFGSASKTAPAGGTMSGNKIGIHTFLRNTINVMDMPTAVGDGVGDDTAALIAAYNATAVGGTLLLPPGNYSFSQWTIAKAITIKGDGKANLIQKTASAGVSAVRFVASGITWDGVNVDGVVAAGTENHEELACIHITWDGSVGPLSNITIQNSSLTGKVAGIFTDDRDNTNVFALKNVKFIKNKVRGLQYGIFVGAFLQSTILHKDIRVESNDIRVSAIGGYGSFYDARPMQIWNAHNVKVVDNDSVGGFSCIELISSPASSLAHRYGNQAIGNRGDSHLSFTQTDGGVLTGNTVDMALRDPDGEGWPAYDHATVVAQYGYLPGIEASDNYELSETGNTVRNPVGDCLDFGANRSSSCTGNNLSGAGTTAGTPVNAHGIIIRYGNNTDSVIANNTIRNCARSGISQDTGTNWAPIDRMKIVHNTILNVQEHGIHIQNASDITISHNGIKNCNLAAGTFNGLDFTATFGGNSVIVKADDNTVDGCYRAIYQPYFSSTNNRLSQFRRNTAVSHTATNAYVIFGHRSDNWAPIMSTGYVAAIASTHINMDHGLDLIYVQPGVATNLAFFDNLSIGDRFTIVFLDANTTVINAVDRMNLAGSANVTPTTKSMMVFQCLQDSNPVAEAIGELSRMIR